MVEPLEIVVIPRGIKFKVEHAPGQEGNNTRGYICETHTGHFTLPDLGPIGSNSLANPMHFQTPVSFYEDDSSDWEIVAKFGDKFFTYK